MEYRWGVKGASNESALLDFVADMHGMVGGEHFRRDMVRRLLEVRLIAAPIVHALEFDPARGETLVEDADGPVLVNGVPLGDLLPGRQEEMPSFQRALGGDWEPTVMTQFLSPSKLRSTQLYGDVNRPLGTLDVLLVPLVRADKIYSIVFSRETCFAERDRHMAIALQRHAIAALRNHQALVHAEEGERLLRQAGGRPLMLDVRPDGSIAEWTPEAAAWFAAGSAKSSARPPGDLADWVRERVRHYPWLSPEANALRYAARPEHPGIRVHFLGRRNGRHELLCVRAEGAPSRYGLTDREEGVLRWICKGKDNGEIAAILGISVNTVRNHVARILEKTMTESRLSAAALARDWFDG